MVSIPVFCLSPGRNWGSATASKQAMQAASSQPRRKWQSSLHNHQTTMSIEPFSSNNSMDGSRIPWEWISISKGTSWRKGKPIITAAMPFSHTLAAIQFITETQNPKLSEHYCEARMIVTVHWWERSDREHHARHCCVLLIAREYGNDKD